MRLPLCEQLGIEFPLFAFSHCRDVVAAVTNAGGLGVLGIGAHSPEEVEMELAWLDEQTHGRSYGVDVVIAAKFEGKAESAGAGLDFDAMAARVPPAQREYAAEILREHDVEPPTEVQPPVLLPSEAKGQAHLDVCFRHPIKLIANALGVPPAFMIEQAHAHGVPVAALVGSAEHAVKQARAGVDVIVAQGTEAGGHCGEVTTFVLVPEVVDALDRVGLPVPVLAAGGIMTGRHIAAALALGAAGAWTGTVWLTTNESEVAPYLKQKLIAATSRDTVRTRARTGKPCRQLRSDWTEAWDENAAPAPLPMPLQSMISEPALRRADALADKGHAGAQALGTTLVGQGVGYLTRTRPAREVSLEMIDEMIDTIGRLGEVLTD